jgi:hypothetical protein
MVCAVNSWTPAGSAGIASWSIAKAESIEALASGSPAAAATGAVSRNVRRLRFFIASPLLNCSSRNVNHGLPNAVGLERVSLNEPSLRG